MEKKIIKPVGTKSEVTWLLTTIILVVVISGSIIAGRARKNDVKKLQSHQISAFKDLNTLDQGTFNDLYAAAMEIEEIHSMDEKWPSPKELELEVIPPFIKDQVWVKRGKINWSLRSSDTEEKHLAVYFGSPSEGSLSGSFLLILRHNHKEPLPGEKLNEHGPYEIWYQNMKTLDFPKITTDPALIAKGWKEVAPYKGEEEVKRLKGDIAQ